MAEIGWEQLKVGSSDLSESKRPARAVNESTGADGSKQVREVIFGRSPDPARVVEDEGALNRSEAPMNLLDHPPPGRDDDQARLRSGASHGAYRGRRHLSGNVDRVSLPAVLESNRED